MPRPEEPNQGHDFWITRFLIDQLIQAALKLRIKLQAAKTPPDEDWPVQRIPYRQAAFAIEYSGFFRLLSAVALSYCQRTVNSLIDFAFKQIEKEKHLSAKHLLCLAFPYRNPCWWWHLNPNVLDTGCYPLVTH